jgi:hypothetical protein
MYPADLPSKLFRQQVLTNISTTRGQVLSVVSALFHDAPFVPTLHKLFHEEEPADVTGKFLESTQLHDS